MINTIEGPLTELADANACTINDSATANHYAGVAITRGLEYDEELPQVANNAQWNAVAYARRARELATVGR